MKILILGAAGQIARILTNDLLMQTQYELVLYARNAAKRLKVTDPKRTTIIDGDFSDHATLNTAMKGVDAVYLNAMDDEKGLKNIIKVMEENGTKRFIGASILGIYNEVPGAFGQWNTRMVGQQRIDMHARHAKLIEQSSLHYTLLRLTWLYNEKNNRIYQLTQKGEAFEGAQVTREAVSQLIIDLINEPSEKYSRTSLGVSRPGTAFDKPLFY